MYKALYNHRSKENETRKKDIRNKTKKVVPRVMRMKAEREIEAFSESPNPDRNVLPEKRRFDVTDWSVQRRNKTSAELKFASRSDVE